MHTVHMLDTTSPHAPPPARDAEEIAARYTRRVVARNRGVGSPRAAMWRVVDKLNAVARTCTARAATARTPVASSRLTALASTLHQHAELTFHAGGV